MKREWRTINIIGSVLLVLGAIGTALINQSSQQPEKTIYSLLSIVGAGVGASLLASGLTTAILSRQIWGLDIAEAMEALRGSSFLYRANQSIEITLASNGQGIRIDAEHKFDLQGNLRKTRQVLFSLYTDVARWGAGGGFVCIVEPSGSVLRGAELENYMKRESGKIQFERIYTFKPGIGETFIIETYGEFRKSDRLFWTVENISTDLRVRINDYTGLNGDLGVKINHHRSASIEENFRRRPANSGTVLEFEFLGEVLPYQGFELQWTYLDQPKEREESDG